MVVADLSYVLSKHVRWQILQADLLQYFLSETVCDASSIQELVKKTKTCLTSIRLGQGECLGASGWFGFKHEFVQNMENTMRR